MITEDLDIFFDLNGFASLHMIDGTPDVVCIVGDKATGRSELDGLWVSMFEIMVRKGAIVEPEKKQKLSFDGDSYTVEGVKDDGAVLTITLSSARPGAVLNPV